MDNSPSTVGRVPARLDRYPGKMVSHLARTLVERYARDADHLVDPFCGSGAILCAGRSIGLRVSGVDVNPFAVLLARVKIEGFDVDRAAELCSETLELSLSGAELPMRMKNRDYWFTPATLRKLQELRFAASELGLYDDRAGRAVLLALALSVRPCSRADQRSPKPFISQTARLTRRGKHYDPRATVTRVLVELSGLYGGESHSAGKVIQLDTMDGESLRSAALSCSHIITSPPYVNAQDYYRNSKLELYVLEDLAPFRMSDIVTRFIGTERGGIFAPSDERAAWRRQLVPELMHLETHRSWHAGVVHRYLRDVERAFRGMIRFLAPGGTLVVVCGDNLVGGMRIVTWKALDRIVEGLGVELFDRFEDRIRNRSLAPRRKGHTGLIKQEVISAYRRP